MNLLFKVAVGAVLACLAMPAGGQQPDQQSAPASVREFIRRHDRIVAGENPLSADLAAASAQTVAFFTGLPDSDLRSDPVWPSAVLFVLSGGDASILKRAGAEGAPKEERDRLIAGAFAYAQGRAGEAEPLLLPLEASRFDPMLGGHLALAQALLASRTDTPRAFALLETARQMLPGTLVEEAALRHTASLASKAGEWSRYESAVIRYFRRFAHSAFAPGVRKQLVQTIVSSPAPEAALQRFLSALGTGEEADKGTFLAAVAQQALLNGALPLAAFASDAALPLVTADSGRERLSLYKAIALTVSERYEAGVDALQKMDRTRLSADDTNLLNAALDLAVKLREPPAAPNVSVPETPRVTSARRVFAPGDVYSNARNAIGLADNALGKGK